MPILQRLLLSFMIVFALVTLCGMASFLLVMAYYALGESIIYVIIFLMLWAMVYYLTGEFK